MAKSSAFVRQILNKVVLNKYLSKNELPEETVARVLLTGILKNQFYRSVDDAVKEAFPLFIDRAKIDPDFLLRAACLARNTHMKGMVKVALAAIAGSSTDEFLNKDIVKNTAIALLATFHPGQLIQFVELVKSKQFGRGFGSRPQKWVRSAMEGWSYSKLEKYTLQYPTALNQLVRLVHPRYTDGRSGVILYVLDGRKGEATGKKQIVVEGLKKVKDPNIIATSMLDNEIPWDVIKGFAGLDGPLALACMTQMGLTALLLNIHSLEQHDAFATSHGLTALSLKMNEVKNGRSRRLGVAKPYIYASNQKIKDILLDAMVDTLDVDMGVVESLRVGVSVDISGSMNGVTLQTAGLLSVPFLKSKDLWFTTFNTCLFEEEETTSYNHNMWGGGGGCPKIKGLSRKNQVKALLGLTPGGGTNISVPIVQATKKKHKMDLMVLITDEQQNAGTPLMSAWENYKKVVNPEAQLWIINATNYQWHSADFGDRSVTVYQTMTPALFKNLEYVGQNLTQAIRGFDLEKFANGSEKKEE